MDLNELNKFDLRTADSKKGLISAFKGILEKFSADFTEMVENLKSEFMDLVKERDNEIKTLKNDAAQKEAVIQQLKRDMVNVQKQVSVLEDRIEDNDIYERKDTVVISGNKVPVVSSSENTFDVALKLLNGQLKTTLNSSDFSEGHRLRPKKPNQTPERVPIIIKFCRRNLKTDVLSRARTAKIDGFFVNEHLTPMQTTISYVLRRSKREFPSIVSGTTSFDGKNYVWIKAPRPDAPGARDTRVQVSTRRRLEEFCLRTLDKPLEDFIGEWKH